MTPDETIFKRNVLPFLRPHRLPDGTYKSPSRIWVSTFSDIASTLVMYDVGAERT